ncbi:hypothetical protein CDAR_212231 [Caerostris darwini]|uniref:Uncharacterized protein n=1 Tax=Caerostris darwini TaxID=1538125 RepID=A0AAV4NTH5_9ARAC|nr:hypothetical protein CDAR_212231 [Caerostris darwini]
MIIAFNILDAIFAFIKERNNRLTASKQIQIIIIDCDQLNIDEMLVYPSTEQYQLPYQILKPTTNFDVYNNLPTYQEDIPEITIELQKPTIDQLISYPTVEQFYLSDNILKPIVSHQTCLSTAQQQTCKAPLENTPTILIKFGKPY